MLTTVVEFLELSHKAQLKIGFFEFNFYKSEKMAFL